MAEAKKKPNNAADNSGENKTDKPEAKQKSAAKKPQKAKKPAKAKRSPQGRPPQGRPPQGRPPQNGGRRPPPGYKKKKKGGFSVALNFILIIGILAVGSMIYYDVMGAKDYANQLLDLQPPITASSVELAEKEDAIRMVELDVENKEDEIIDLEDEIDVINQELSDANDEIDDLKDKLAHSEEEVAVKVDYFEKVAKLYEEMDTKKAVGIISKMENISDIVNILGNMSSEKAAAILAGLKADLATQITAEMIN